MRALVVPQPGSPQPAEVREVPDPVTKPNEAMVTARAFSLNRSELRQLAQYPDWIPGQDIAGVVLEPAADGSGPAAGARVVAVVDEGGWAERVPAPTARLAVLPDG